MKKVVFVITLMFCINSLGQKSIAKPPVPVIPITYAWDAQASMPRMYAMKDLDEMTKSIASNNYKWEKGFGMNSKNKKMGTYLLGHPI